MPVEISTTVDERGKAKERPAPDDHGGTPPATVSKASASNVGRAASKP